MEDVKSRKDNLPSAVTVKNMDLSFVGIHLAING